MSAPLRPALGGRSGRILEPALPDVDRTAQQIAGPSLNEYPSIAMHQGKVVAVNVAAQTVDVTKGGDATVIPGVKHNSNYRPAVNDIVWMFEIGHDFLVLDRQGPFGPSVISTAAGAFVDTQQTRTSGTYGDLATVGPQVTVVVSPSGRLLVQVSANLLADPAIPWAGGLMGIALSGANTQSPDDREAIELFFSNTVTSAVVTCASKVTLMTGLSPGSTTVTAKYRNSGTGGAGAFALRHLWALPL